MLNKIFIKNFEEPQDYQAFFLKQLSYHDNVLRGNALGYLLFLEHTDIYTIGRFGKTDENINENATVPLVRTTRGGNVTYHGVGQLVFYPILNTNILKLKLKDLVDALQEAVLGTLSVLGLVGRKNVDGPGVWIGDKKIASIGLSLKKGVSMHGLSINLNCSLDKFELIKPCGNPKIMVGNLSDYINIEKREFVKLFSKNFFSQVKLKINYPKKKEISLSADSFESEP